INLKWKFGHAQRFDNLTSLTLGEWCMSNKFSPLLHFLWFSPLLEDLTLKLNM
ncbi:hypothetical protein E2562_009154, partial [Oryza meyeriana var. granulata]